MKEYKTIQVVILLVLGYFVFSSLVITPKFACQNPIEYSLGDIDPQFGISTDSVIDIISATEQIWEKPAGLNLFEYNTSSNFKINFVFDERQKEFIDSKKLEGKLSKTESLIEEKENQYDYLLSLYNQKLSLFNNSSELYEQRLESYNSKVDSWNRRGGAPEYVYNSLERERRELDDVADQLNNDSYEINSLVTRMNSLGDNSTQLIQEHNVKVETYNNKYGGGKEFNQADYTGNEINVYQFGSIAELKLVLAHELGHALTLDHVENSSSIMYYLMDGQNLKFLSLTQEDSQALKNLCNLEKINPNITQSSLAETIKDVRVRRKLFE